VSSKQNRKWEGAKSVRFLSDVLDGWPPIINVKKDSLAVHYYW